MIGLEWDLDKIYRAEDEAGDGAKNKIYDKTRNRIWGRVPAGEDR
jgi:hypothetical protein